jgi:hypothetical protein
VSQPPPGPLPAGTIRLSELPMADSRTAAYALVRGAGPVVRGPRGGYMVVSAQAAEFVLKHPELLAPGVTPRVSWPAGVVGFDRLPLVFPAA